MKKSLAPPRWWKNTYFWIAAFLVVVALVGVLRGDEVIRDPGQKDEGGLVLIYLGGAAISLINGIISHRQYVRHYNEETGKEDDE